MSTEDTDQPVERGTSGKVTDGTDLEHPDCKQECDCWWRGYEHGKDTGWESAETYYNGGYN